MYRMPIIRFVRLPVGTAALLAVLASAAAYADTPIHLSRDAAPNAQIVISNVKGEVRVSGWNQNRIQVEGTLGDGARPLQISGDPQSLEIRVEPSGKSTKRFVVLLFWSVETAITTVPSSRPWVSVRSLPVRSMRVAMRAFLFCG